jgi:lipoyl(octanoyl) transferase
MAYAPAYDTQLAHLEEVMAAREAGLPIPGFLLLVEHEAVVTISRRAGAANHLLASPDMLERQGVAVAETDRGGDITYHGPGQIVAYPVLDLNVLNLGLHEYMRLLEQAVIDTCGTFGVETHRDPAATGVWVQSRVHGTDAKIAAMGVRVKRWVSLHGLALNVTTNLEHFGLIVPCGLAGRPVTSLRQQLGDACPTFGEVKAVLAAALTRQIGAAFEAASEKRARVV